METVRIENIEGETWCTMDVLYEREGGLLERGQLHLVKRADLLRHHYGACVHAEPGGPLRGWGEHDCETSVRLTHAGGPPCVVSAGAWCTALDGAGCRAW